MDQSNASDAAAELERIKTRILGLVENKFGLGDTVYYLSQLGIDLGDDRLRIEKLARKRLKAFLETDLGLPVQVLGEHHNIFALVREGEPPPNPTSKPRRYAGALHKAFIEPLADGEHRFINLDTVRFGTSKEQVASGDDRVVEIAPEYLLRPGVADPRLPLERLERWLVDQGLDPEIFERARRAPASRSLLDHLLAALEAEQLKRVTLPLDIVQVLKDRSVR